MVKEKLKNINKRSLHIYSNIASEILYIENNVKDITELIILKTDGRVWKVFPVSNDETIQVIQVNDLSTGIYFLQSTDKEGNKQTTRFIVNK